MENYGDTLRQDQPPGQRTSGQQEQAGTGTGTGYPQYLRSAERPGPKRDPRYDRPSGSGRIPSDGNGIPDPGTDQNCRAGPVSRGAGADAGGA